MLIPRSRVKAYLYVRSVLTTQDTAQTLNLTGAYLRRGHTNQ
jgi:hypothetical protein